MTDGTLERAKSTDKSDQIEYPLARWLFIFILLLFLSPQGLLAGDHIFGPHTYERNDGRPHTHSTIFPSLTTGLGHLLEIRNGNNEGGDRVSSAIVTINGIDVVKPSDLSQQVAHLTREVTLGSSNTFSVRIFGAPGSFLTIAIIGTSQEPRDPPTVFIEAQPATISQGDTATLSWEAANAHTVSIDHGIGEVEITGSLLVSPAETTTYTISASGPGGSASDSVKITVEPLPVEPPTVFIEAQPATIDQGDTATLSWEATNAHTVSIDHGIGEVEITGSLLVSPAETTTYTISASGPGGSASDSVTIILASDPPPVASAARVTRANVNTGFIGSKQIVRTSTGRLYYLNGNAGHTGFWDGWIEVHTSETGYSWQKVSAQDEWYWHHGISAAIDSTNVIHVISYNWNQRPYYRQLNTVDSVAGSHSWGAVEQLDLRTGASGSLTSIAIDANDVPHVLYQLREQYRGSYYTSLHYANRVEGVWRTITLIPVEAQSQATPADIAIGPDNIPYILAGNQMLKGNANNPSFFDTYTGTGTGHSFVIHQNGNVRVAADLNGNYINYLHDATQSWSQGWELLDSGLQGGQNSRLVLLEDTAYATWVTDNEFWVRKGFDQPMLIARIPDGYGNLSSFVARWSFYNHHRPDIIDFGSRSWLSSWGAPNTGNHYWHASLNPTASASFSAHPTQSLGAPLTVQFTGHGYPAIGASIIGWAWDFDNNGQIDSYEQNPTHTYTEIGLYSVRLNVTDSFGNTGTALRENYIQVGVDSDGTPYYGQLSLSSDTVDFGTINTGGYHWASLEIANNGTGLLDLGAIPSLEAPFSVSKDNCSGAVLYTHGPTCTIMLGFTPAAEGVHSAKLIIPSNDPDSPLTKVSLVGKSESGPHTAITGTVSSRETSEPLAGALVSVLHARDIHLSPGDYDIANWGPAEFEAIRENNDVKAVDSGSTSKIFRTRNPFVSPDPISITWNGLGCDSRDQVLGQSFIAGDNGLLTGVSLKLAREVGAEDRIFGNVKVFLKSQTGGDSDAVLAESNSVAARDLDTSGAWEDFSFSEPAALIKGQNYVLELAGDTYRKDFFDDVLFRVYWRYQTPDPYKGGEGFQRKQGIWEPISGSFAFRTFIDGKEDQAQVAECSSCPGISNQGSVVRRMQLHAYNHKLERWDHLQTAQHELGYDDVTLAGLILDNSADYYDSDGWIETRITYTPSMQHPMPFLATDYLAIDFLSTHSGETDASGQYSISGLQSGSYDATADKAGYHPENTAGAIIAGETHRRDFQLQPAPPLMITITSPDDGAKVTGWPLLITGTVTNEAEVTVNGQTATLNGENYRANLYPAGYGEYVINVTAVDQYGQSRTATIEVLLDMGQITGVVTATATGQPIQGTTIQLRASQSSPVYQTVYSGPDGSYELMGLPPGSYYLTASRHDYLPVSFSGEIAGGQSLVHDMALKMVAPVISNIGITEITTNSATVIWTTNQPADSMVEYGETSAYGSSVADATLVLNHSMELADLKPGTTYHFRLISTNSDGSSRSTSNQTLQTETSSNPPEISNIEVVDITGTSATIAWITDQPADSVVEYGTSQSYGQTVSKDHPTTIHTLTITGLAPGSNYHFRITSTNSDGDSQSSDDLTFRTNDSPTISNIAVENITANSATITWSTDQPATGKVEYGETTAYGLTVGSTEPTTSHRFTLTDLNSGQQHHFRVSSSNQEGQTTTSGNHNFETIALFNLQILSPQQHETIPRSNVLVKGTISHNEGLETGIVVNGVTALVHNGSFVADVPLQPGDNTLIVGAIDIKGQYAAKSLYLTSSPAARYITVNANAESGPAPLEIKLGVEAGFSWSGQPQLSYLGPGVVDIVSSSTDGWELRLNAPGIYEFTVTVQDEQGAFFSDQVAVLAIDRTALNHNLQAKWEGMKQALIAGDIDTAVEHFSLWQQDTFREIFTIMKAELPQIAQEMQDIEMIHQKNNTAEYRIRREVVFRGEPEIVTFYIYFEKGVDGIWRIRDF
ncbi:fibronectin type III domain-containing protein [Desulfurivibrio sp. D14AmB]|uniref:fibronectin type III domain-containing protein n=1 Tax=Desulfurivibrio sp. D14AmB TaxID=3374370 RepID=UPI00376EBE35